MARAYSEDAHRARAVRILSSVYSFPEPGRYKAGKFPLTQRFQVNAGARVDQDGEYAARHALAPDHAPYRFLYPASQFEYVGNRHRGIPGAVFRRMLQRRRPGLLRVRPDARQLERMRVARKRGRRIRKT